MHNSHHRGTHTNSHSHKIAATFPKKRWGTKKLKNLLHTVGSFKGKSTGIKKFTHKYIKTQTLISSTVGAVGGFLLALFITRRNK